MGGVINIISDAPNGDLDGQPNQVTEYFHENSSQSGVVIEVGTEAGEDQNFPDAKLVVYTKNVRSLCICSTEKLHIY